MNAFCLQKLAPVDARLCLGVERFLREEAGLALERQLVVAAVSGGADSMALLHILYVLRIRMGFELHVVSLDHGLRPSGAAEAAAVAARCDELGLGCLVRCLDVAGHAAEQGMGLEQAGRNLRYAALEQERARLGADWIATGHQREDLGEDVLLRLLRGTGWPGLGGMCALDAQRRLLRPLLLTSGQDLRAFLTRCGLVWHEDASNEDQSFKRNRIRHSIWPLLVKENPRIGEHMARLWRLARTDGEYWDSRLAHFLPSAEPAESSTGRADRAGQPLCFDRAVLRSLGKAERLRLYLRAVELVSRERGGQARGQTLFALDDAWLAGHGKSCFQFPGGIMAELRDGGVCFFAPDYRERQK